MTPPRTIADRYELLDRLGQGGGGVVWRARDLALDRVVAVKEIQVDPGLAPEDRDRARRRGLREARAAARLDHPNVVSVFDVRDDDEAIHIVMEHVDAPSLQTIVAREGSLPVERVATIGLEVVTALEAAHAAGVVHRDVKPSNVLVGDDGSVHVTDFGIAVMSEDTSLTMTGQSLGTPDFVSPEQAAGEEVGPASDVWSLGATLFAAVEGERPFRRDHPVSTVHAVVHSDPRPVARAGALAPLLHAMLAKEPGDRPSLAQVRARLSDVLARDDGPDTAAIGPTGADHTRPLPVPWPDTTAPVAGATPTPPRSEDTPPPAGPTPPSAAGRPSAPPVTVRTQTTPPPERRRGAPTALVAAGLLALVAVAVLVVVVGRSDDGTPVAEDAPTAADEAPAEDAGTPTGEPTADPTPTAEPSDPADPTAGPTTPAEPSDEEPADDPATPVASGELPEGWEAYEGPSYTVGHPAGWTERDAEAPNNVDLVAPDGVDGYLRVANTDSPADDVELDTERIEAAFADGHDDYQRLRLEPTDYRDTEAVLWEYTFTAGGEPYHAIHLNLSTGERGYALNHVVPEAGWDEAAARFEQFTASFRPAG